MKHIFHAGIATTSIHPSSVMIYKSLHHNMTVRFDQQGSEMFTKVLVMSLKNQVAVIVTLDLVVMYTEQAILLRQQIADQLGLRIDQIIVHCTHSHSTPFPEPLTGPHPFMDYIVSQTICTAKQAWLSRKPARVGYGETYAVGASFNTDIPLEDGRVKMTRNFREGLASGEPIDPRLSIIRIDDAKGFPMAGWVRFAAHPACVIFNTPVSAEYPGYMTQRISKAFNDIPVLFACGSSGDVNCIPMFGTEQQCEILGDQLADLVINEFRTIRTDEPAFLASGNLTIDLPLEAPPSTETLEHEIEEIDTFMREIEKNPELEWAMGINCGEEWSIDKKKKHYIDLKIWALKTIDRIRSGYEFPTVCTSVIGILVVDGIALVYYPGEPYVQLGLELSVKSPFEQTFLMSLGNGLRGYLCTKRIRERINYQGYSFVRYFEEKGTNPLPYTPHAAEIMIHKTIEYLRQLRKE